MSKYLLFSMLLSCLAMLPCTAQKILGGNQLMIDTRYLTTAATVEITAWQTIIVADMSEGSYTVTISEPSEKLDGYHVEIIQVDVAALQGLTLNSTAGGGNEFREGNSDLLSTVNLTLGSQASKNYVCMRTSVGTYQWVLVSSN